MNLTNARRIVIKVGSSLMTDEANGKVRADWLASMVEDLVRLRKSGKEIIIVSSGAVALGRKTLGINDKNLRLEEKQAAAACGQLAMMRAWREALEKHHISAAQLLLTIDDSENRRRYLNARNTLETLLAHHIVPIINENDTVATAEIRFGDNDRLAARVAQMASAEILILLSDIDGLYTADPHTNKEAKFIPEVKQITAEIEQMGGDAVSSVGTGGMATKIAAAKIALAAGCHMLVMAGKEPYPITRLENGERGTWFIADANPMNARKHWISGAINPSGAVWVDDGAAKALKSGKNSLLPAGVVKVEGGFERGDAVLIKDAQGNKIGKGLVAYSSADAEQIAGHQSQEIEELLGFKGRVALIHKDDLVLE